MVKTYSFKVDGNKQISTNFKVSEFRCSDSDKILISEEIVKQLQEIRNFGGVNKITIESGYRTPAYDKKIGGSGTGSHCEGKAVDFIVYDKKGVIIPSNYICCYLQDKGILGIEKCNANSTHMDIGYRKNKWYAYQVVVNGKRTYPTVSNFYTFTKLTQTQVYSKLGLPIPSKTGTSPVITGKYNLTRVLKSGQSGKDCLELQKELNKRGFRDSLKRKLVEDSKIGNNTIYALKQFQKSVKLTADGLTGVKTAHALGWHYNGK